MKRLARTSPQERGDVLRIAAEKYGLAPALIEKDFWVCWTLQQLFALPEVAPHLLFKGGTSLSKVYGAIQRFSEDVDISLSRDFVRPGAGDAAEAQPLSNTRRKKEIETLVASFHQTVADVVLPRLRTAIQGELGTEAHARWRLEPDMADAGTLLFVYPAGIGKMEETPPYNAPAVRIEMGGRSDTWPGNTGIVKPYAAQVVPQAFETAEVSVRVLALERTFWEKATLLHNEFYRPEQKRRGERISRHYYDLAQLADHPEMGARSLAVRSLLDRVVEHKTLYYNDSWSRYAEAANGAIRLVPAEREQSRLRGDYQQMRPMFFGQPPDFDDILSTLTRLERQINTKGGSLGYGLECVVAEEACLLPALEACAWKRSRKQANA